jgi:benzoate/toluate 1,2-dioxygenase beta subunit
MVDSYSADTELCVVNSKLILVQYRRGDQDVFAAACTHHLRREQQALRIAMKRVDLVNCDAPLGNILVYL